jgi:hypothetical protein
MCGIIKSESKGTDNPTNRGRKYIMRKTLEKLIEVNLKNQEVVRNHPTMSEELKAWNLARLQGYLEKYQNQLAKC